MRSESFEEQYPSELCLHPVPPCATIEGCKGGRAVAFFQFNFA